MTKKIGITGGIGAGKSTVAHFFSILGVPIYNADNEAKAIMAYQQDVINEIKQLLGNESYIDGVINRKWIAEKVFTYKVLLEGLNQIVHPRVAIHFENWVTQFSNFNYVLKEAAVLTTNESYKQLDEIILVKAPLDLKIKRIQQRDPFRSKEEIFSIIQQQQSDEEMEKYARFVIQNNENELIINQVLAIHQLFTQK